MTIAYSSLLQPRLNVAWSTSCLSQAITGLCFSLVKYDAEAKDGELGEACDIMFYPASMSEEFRIWTLVYAQGRYDQQPPESVRHMWAPVLAHELPHCLKGGSGERVADRWGDRVTRLLLEKALEGTQSR